MNCKCDYKNSYDVIVLENNCPDAPKGNAWTEISVPEMLKIPACKPDIESIEKIIVTPRITAKRIIATPSSEGTDNEEGMQLTNRKLLVDGMLCQKVLYTSDEPGQTLVAVDFEIPFYTYIVIAADTDINNGKFCVNVCVEDVFIQMIDQRNLFKNVTLFLEAIDPCPTA